MDGPSVAGGRRGPRGGILSGDPLDAGAAAIVFLGAPGWRLLTTGDDTERVLLQALTRRAIELTERRDEALANRIANAVGRLLR